jgi:hypothetical protein
MQSARTTDRDYRINRIRKRGIPELIQALDCGELGVKEAERISRLPKAKQCIEVFRCLEARKANVERQAVWRNNPLSAGRSPYASDSYAEAKRRRLCRIGGHAARELTEAFNAGQLSLRRYDLLSRLSPASQRKALQADRRQQDGQSLAAHAIHLILAEKTAQIDLAAVEARIIESIRSRGT